MQVMQPAHFEGSAIIERLSLVTLVGMYADYSKKPQERAQLKQRPNARAVGTGLKTRPS
jgi:hypothetical protein